MPLIEFPALRQGLARLPSDHDATGEHRPTPEEVFTPSQHAVALDSNTTIVVGARGMGKSFWAGVLRHDDTRKVASLAYPKLKLDQALVVSGYDGMNNQPKIIDARVPDGEETKVAYGFWQAVAIKAATEATMNDPTTLPTLKQIMARFSDPEEAAQELARLDQALATKKQTLLITFDALDTISRDWRRAGLLLDGLFEVIWSLRTRRAIRAKVFIRPEQLHDPALRFIELPKLRSGAVELNWSQTELYGLLFWRLAQASGDGKKQFALLAEQAGAKIPQNLIRQRQSWPLLTEPALQKRIMSELAGQYMGRTKKQGGTYDWPFNHLADAKGQVTPRSFIKLFVEAAKSLPEPLYQAINFEGIRDGLRAASRVRVDQLGIEYPWIKRALLPLAGLSVPCTEELLHQRWSESKTIENLLQLASDPDNGFLPPFPPHAKTSHFSLLTTAMENIGVLGRRIDERVDMPDLFRIAAKMLKKGGTTPNRKNGA